MDARDITSIAIKFFGIYLLVNVVLYFPTMITSLNMLMHMGEEAFSPEVFIGVVGSFILLGIVVSFVLFRIAKSISSKTTDTVEGASNLSQEFLLQVLGIYFIVSALIALPGYGMRIFTLESDFAWALYGIGYAFEASVGLYLMVKPMIWRQWLNKLRGRS